MNQLKIENINPFFTVKNSRIISLFMQLIVAELPIALFLGIVASQKVLPGFLFNKWFYLSSYLIIYIWYFWWLIKAVKQGNSLKGWIKELRVILLVSLSLFILR